MKWALLAGILIFASACIVEQNSPPVAPSMAGNQVPAATAPLDPQTALGLWKSSFGPVKIELDDNGQLLGIWSYDREGQTVVGYFQGSLSGNVLSLRWHEPGSPTDLTGEGYIMFDPYGRNFQGRWWTNDRTRGGNWNGWRLR